MIRMRTNVPRPRPKRRKSFEHQYADWLDENGPRPMSPAERILAMIVAMAIVIGFLILLAVLR